MPLADELVTLGPVPGEALMDRPSWFAPGIARTAVRELSMRVRSLGAPILGAMESPALGFLHITRGPGPSDPVNAEYRIVFAPLGGRLRNRHAQCHGLDALTDFLRLARVPLPEIERAWQNLAKRRIYSVPRVALTRAQIDALGL